MFFVNRQARRGADKIDEAADILRGHGFHLVEPPPHRPAEMTDVIHRHRERVDLVIIGGGDGTLNSAVEGLVATHLPLGILPLGTANDLAQTLGIPLTLPEACAVIAHGSERAIDVGWVNGKYFCNEAGCGMSRRLARILGKSDKKAFGVLAVAAKGLQVLRSARPFEAEIVCDGEATQVRTAHLMIGNSNSFGGVIKSNDASIDDSRLDLYSLEIGAPWETIKALPDVVRGTYRDSSVVRLLQGRRFEVSTKRPLAVDTDGEITTQTPAKFEIRPRAVTVFVPAAEA